MKKRKFLTLLLSVITVAALAIPTLTAFAETQTTTNPKTITVEIFNNNPDEVDLLNATAIDENGITVIAAESTKWNGNQIKFKNNYRDLTVAKSGQLCFEYKSTNNKSWANVCAVAMQDGWAQTFSVCGGGETLGISSEYVIKRYNLSTLTDAQLTKFYGFAIVFSANETSFNIKRVWIEYPNPDYVEDTTVDITFYDGNNKIEDLSTSYSTVDGILPKYTVDGKVFVGWQTADGALYAAGTSVTAETPTELYAAAIEFSTADGAWVWVSKDASVSGLGFDTTFKTAKYSAIENFITEYGTLILPRDFITEEKEFTLENFVVDQTILKIKSTVSTTSDNGVTTYRGALFEIKEANYNRYFAARGYFTVKYTNGETKNFYSAAYAYNSVARVAKVFKESDPGYEKLSDEQKNIVDAYAAAYQEQ